MACANAELPRKSRVRKRKRSRLKGRNRMDRTGRTYADFEVLPLADRARVVMGDSVEGFRGESGDILSLHVLARRFQPRLFSKAGSAAETVARLGAVEAAMGSRAAFAALFRAMLVDRGVEFDDWEGMERSCLEPGARRCRVFYCDATGSNQKSEAERNHEQRVVRRVIPGLPQPEVLLPAARTVVRGEARGRPPTPCRRPGPRRSGPGSDTFASMLALTRSTNAKRGRATLWRIFRNRPPLQTTPAGIANGRRACAVARATAGLAPPARASRRRRRRRRSPPPRQRP
jgi:hypothetical protein